MNRSQLSAEIGVYIRRLTKSNSFDKADLTEILKATKRYLDREWVEVAQHGLPDDEGNYLVKYTDGEIEVLDFDPADPRPLLWERPIKLSKGPCKVTHWTDLPEGPK